MALLFLLSVRGDFLSTEERRPFFAGMREFSAWPVSSNGGDAAVLAPRFPFEAVRFETFKDDSADQFQEVAMSDTAEKKFVLYDTFDSVNQVDPRLYEKYDVKRGLRNADGTGVVTGITKVANVHGYLMDDGYKIPDEGALSYRGYDLYDLVDAESIDKRFNFEEVAYLLLTSDLPNARQLEDFVSLIDAQRELPDGFTASFFFGATPPNIMNLLSRVVLNQYADDLHAEDRSSAHEIDVAISLMSKLPRAAVLSYYAVHHRFNNDSLIIHPFIPGQSTAETILSTLRPNRKFSQVEARMLDIMLCVHMEHGGGNNSAFATHVLSSADTDAYSAYSAAIGSMKGARHGGANLKAYSMQKDLKLAVADWENEDEIAAYLHRVLAKEAFDKTGLIYGVGHAVYTKSDPRARICHAFARKLATGTEYERELALLEAAERLAPQVISQEKDINVNEICVNVDFYSGFIYHMLGIPEDLFTPLFACGRFPGWAAHRFEEIVAGKRIIRPAYKNASHVRRTYVPLEQR